MVQEDDLIITKHAAEKMVVEGISRLQICRALERGSKFKQTDGHIVLYTYFSVAYKKVENRYKIKTVFINKNGGA